MSGRSRRRGFGYVRKLPSGRWQASYLGPDLVRRTAPHTFDAKADAEGWLGRRREEVVSGEWQPPVKVERVAALTFDAYATQWLRERALKPRTREGYEHLLGRYLLPVLGRMPIDAITPERGAHLVVAAAGRQADRACPQLRATEGGDEHGRG